MERAAIESLSRQGGAATRDFVYCWHRWGNWDGHHAPIVAVRPPVRPFDVDQVIGFHAAAFGRHYVNSYYQFLLPECRGQGLGGQMVDLLLRTAAKRGCPRLKFKVPFDSDGQRFWEGFGLRPYGKDAKHYLYDLSLRDVHTNASANTIADLVRLASVLCNPDEVPRDRYNRHVEWL